MKAILVVLVAAQFFGLIMTSYSKTPSEWLGMDIFSSILVLVGLVVGLTMLTSKEKTKADVFDVEESVEPDDV